MNSSYCKFLSLLLLQEVFFTDLQKLCLQMPVGLGRFFVSLRRIGFASEKFGLALAGRSAAAAAAFLRSCFPLYVLRTKNGEAQGRYTKLKGAQNAMSTKNSIPVPEK